MFSRYQEGFARRKYTKHAAEVLHAEVVSLMVRNPGIINPLPNLAFAPAVDRKPFVDITLRFIAGAVVVAEGLTFCPAGSIPPRADPCN